MKLCLLHMLLAIWLQESYSSTARLKTLWKQWNSCSHALECIIHSEPTEDTEETLLDLRTNNGSLKKENKENAIKTFIDAFEWLTFTYPADVFSCPVRRPHNTSVLLRQISLKPFSLSAGNHKMSMLTKLKYYPPIWVLFINVEIDVFFPRGGM